MTAIIKQVVNVGLLRRIRNTSNLLCESQWKMLYSTEARNVDKQGGFAKAFQQFQTNLQELKDQDQHFASMLKNSKFTDLGDPEGKIVIGKIFHIVDDDLYIDFGWKFHCVCARPKKNAGDYVRGAKVRLRIRDLELSSKFLGYEKDLTLLEADCILLGLLQDKETTAVKS